MDIRSESDQIASLFAAFRDGNKEAGARLIELFHPELKRLAVSQMRRERQDHSWQPTLLVNEFYLQFIRLKTPAQSRHRNDKAAFFALAGQIMKRLLIHHSRPLSSQIQKVHLAEELNANCDDSLAEVEDVLARLESIKPVIRQVVEMKVFEGLTAEEIASRLSCATVTVNRYWQFACHWLRKEWVP